MLRWLLRFWPKDAWLRGGVGILVSLVLGGIVFGGILLAAASHMPYSSDLLHMAFVGSAFTVISAVAMAIICLAIGGLRVCFRREET